LTGVVKTTAPDGTITTQQASGGITVNFPDGSSQIISADGLSQKFISPKGEVTEYLYNSQGKMTQINLPDGSKQFFNLDGTLAKTEMIEDGLAVTTTYTYSNNTVVIEARYADLTLKFKQTLSLGADNTLGTADDLLISYQAPGVTQTVDSKGRVTQSSPRSHSDRRLEGPGHSDHRDH